MPEVEGEEGLVVLGGGRFGRLAFRLLCCNRARGIGGGFLLGGGCISMAVVLVPVEEPAAALVDEAGEVSEEGEEEELESAEADRGEEEAEAARGGGGGLAPILGAGRLAYSDMVAFVVR